MTTLHADDDKLAVALEIVRSSSEYRVLEKMGDLESESASDQVEGKLALILDLETTGLDAQEDKIIEIGLIHFTYNPDTGQVLGADSPIVFFEDPGQPLSKTIVDLTGITDEMLAGKKIDDDKVHNAIAKASIVIAHNAGFDRPFFDKRFSPTSDQYWACSLNEIPWDKYGYRCAKLSCLLAEKDCVFFDGHRASNDCMALLHTLSHPFSDGELPLNLLLQSARQKSIRIWATGAPYEVKDILKGNLYRWSDGKNGLPKAWWKEVFESEKAEELEWLAEHGYGGTHDRWELESRDASSRYR